MTIYTLGHSTRSLEEFIALLQVYDVEQLADIRSVPKSRRHPHFSLEALTSSLASVGIVYRHFAALGGLRRPRRDSHNSGWRHEGFRGYADYMETPAFERALAELIHWASETRRVGCSPYVAPPTAIMCAEAVWWRCHRQLTSDALVARGIDVRHITSASTAPVHTLTEFARVNADRVSYPGLL